MWRDLVLLLVLATICHYDAKVTLYSSMQAIQTLCVETTQPPTTITTTEPPTTIPTTTPPPTTITTTQPPTTQPPTTTSTTQPSTTISTTQPSTTISTTQPSTTTPPTTIPTTTPSPTCSALSNINTVAIFPFVSFPQYNMINTTATGFNFQFIAPAGSQNFSFYNLQVTIKVLCRAGIEIVGIDTQTYTISNQLYPATAGTGLQPSLGPIYQSGNITFVPTPACRFAFQPFNAVLNGSVASTFAGTFISGNFYARTDGLALDGVTHISTTATSTFNATTYPANCASMFLH